MKYIVIGFTILYIGAFLWFIVGIFVQDAINKWKKRGKGWHER